MGRSAREKRPPALPKVERVELKETHIGLRLAAFALCLALGLSALGFGIYSLLSTEPGWVEIEVSSGDVHCGGDFTFRYLFTGDTNHTAERKRLQTAYTQASVKACKLFETAEIYEGIHNICYINAHPNEDIVVDPVLYQAFQLMEEQKDRTVYLGILNTFYLDLFFSGNDIQAAEFDPYASPETAEFYRELAEFANDPAHIQVKLLGDDTLRLEVSEEYMAYAGDLERESYLDFGWMKNAFIIDYFAGELNVQGFTQGILASFDGFTRTLGNIPEPQTLILYDRAGGRVVEAARAELERPVNIATLRGFPLNSRDEARYYVYADVDKKPGNPYIDPQDGLCKGEYGSLTVYSDTNSCVQLAFQAEWLFRGTAVFCGTGMDDPMSALREQDMEIIAVRNPLDEPVVLYTQDGLTVGDLYDYEGLRYEAKYVPIR